MFAIGCEKLPRGAVWTPNCFSYCTATSGKEKPNGKSSTIRSQYTENRSGTGEVDGSLHRAGKLRGSGANHRRREVQRGHHEGGRLLLCQTERATQDRHPQRIAGGGSTRPWRNQAAVGRASGTGAKADRRIASTSRGARSLGLTPTQHNGGGVKTPAYFSQGEANGGATKRNATRNESGSGGGNCGRVRLLCTRQDGNGSFPFARYEDCRARSLYRRTTFPRFFATQDATGIEGQSSAAESLATPWRGLNNRATLLCPALFRMIPFRRAALLIVINIPHSPQFVAPLNRGKDVSLTIVNPFAAQPILSTVVPR